MHNRQPLSAFVITFNEEDYLVDCLKSLSFCDEVIVVDSYSSDKTVEIAKSFGAQVIQREWPGYRAQKAFGLEQTKYEWVLNLDADERVSEELRAEVERTLDNSNQEICDGYEVNRVVYHLGRWWRSGGWYPEYRVRLLRKSKTIWGGVDPHEKPIVSGKIGRLKGELPHYTYRNLDDQLSRLHKFSSISAKEEFKRGKTAGIQDILLRPTVRFIKFYFLKRGYREGTAGLVVAMIEFFYTFMKYAKLWELGKFGDRESAQK